MSTLSNEEFFDITSSFYDEMISFDNALSRRLHALDKFITSDMKEAADLGCGTGLDSISLAKKNLAVTAFDISPEMISKAEQNSARHGVNINFVQSSLDKISADFNNRFSLAVSLGNTFSNLNRKQLSITIKHMFNILKAKGKVVIQIVNAANLLKKKERILNITEREGIYYVRFYDFLQTHIQFNILRFSGKNISDHGLITTKLYPYKAHELKLLFQKAGFKNIKLYGTLNKEIFSQETSKDIVLTAHK